MKLLFNSGDHLVECREVPIVGAQSPCEFPRAFNGVELGTVRREEDERKIVLAHLSPFFVQLRVMETRIVENNHDLPMRTNGSTPQLFEKCRKRLSIECFYFPAPDKLAIA